MIAARKKERRRLSAPGRQGGGRVWLCPKTLINRNKLHSMIPLSERTIFYRSNSGSRDEFALTSWIVAWDLEEVKHG
jgi:hypothetical protein